MEITRRGPDVTVNFYLTCQIDETLDGFKLIGKCPPPDDTYKGATGVDVKETPADSGLTVVSGPDEDPDPWPMAVKDAKDRWELFEPVELPDMSLEGLTIVGASVDSSGFAADQASFSYGSVSGLAQDLVFSKDDRRAEVGFLELEFHGFNLEAEGASFANGKFDAAAFTVGLPGALGGGGLSGRDLSVGPDGVSGVVSPGTFQLGDLVVEVEDAGLLGDTLVLGKAKLVLPKYLGGGGLALSHLEYNPAEGRLRAEGNAEIHIKDLNDVPLGSETLEGSAGNAPPAGERARPGCRSSSAERSTSLPPARAGRRRTRSRASASSW